jgi:hypothetical protein
LWDDHRLGPPLFLETCDDVQPARIERMSFLLFEEGEYSAGAKLAFGNFH